MLAFTALSFASPRDVEDEPEAVGFSSASEGGLRHADVSAMAHPFAHRREYRIFLPISPEADAAGDAWTDGAEHTVTVEQPDPHDRSRDHLFVDDVEIGADGWRWTADGTTLRWCQGHGDDHLAGELAFDGLGYRAQGSVAFGAHSTEAAAVSAVARFSCRLMHDSTVAYKGSDDSFTLRTEGAFQDPSRWSSPALVWSFWVEEYVDDYGFRTYRPRLRFDDAQTGESFEPIVGTYGAFIDAERHYHFELLPEHRQTPVDDRSALPGDRDRAIKTAFPIRMKVRLDATAGLVEGVVEVSAGGDATEVYALKGEAHVRLQAAARPRATSAPGAVAAAELSPFYLYNLDPYQIDVGGEKVIRDIVQADVEKSLTRIIQHYLPDDLRRRFVSAAPIDLDREVAEIAASQASTGEPAKRFYASLALPFLSMALGQHSRKLNVRRARKLFDERLAGSAIYREHIPKLYAHHFRKRFPELQSYLADETQDVDGKRRQIEAFTAKRAASCQALKDVAETDAVRQQCDMLLEQLQAAKKKALEGKFWAHRVYTHFTSDEFIGMLQMQMFASADGAKAAARNVQRVSTILSILDDSQYFVGRFAEFMNIFRLYSLIVQHANLSQDQKTLRDVTDEIAKKFAEDHAKSTDELQKLLNEQIQRVNADRASGQANLWAKIVDIVHEALLSGERSESLAKAIAKMMAKASDLAAKLEQYLVNHLPTWVVRITKLGLTVTKAMVKLIGIGIGAAVAAGAVVVLATEWSSLDATTQAGLIVMGAGLVASIAVKLLRGAVNLGAKLYGIGSDTSRIAIQWMWQGRGAAMQALALAAEEGAQKLMERIIHRARGIMGRPAVANIISAHAKTAIRWLSGVTRLVLIGIAAVMSIVTIVLSAIELSKATTDLEVHMHRLMIASASFELVGLGFAAASAVASAMAYGAAAAVLSIIAGVFTGFALVLALAGIGIMIYLAWTAAPPDPVSDFARDSASKDGLYMEGETAIDYMLPLYDEKIGYLVKDGIAVATVPKERVGSSFLTILGDGTVGAGPLTRDQTTGFGITVDGEGRARLFAATVPAPGKLVARYLTVGKDGSLRTEDKVLDAEGARQLWVAELKGDKILASGTKDKETALLAGGRFQLHVEDGGKKRYLGLDGRGFRVFEEEQEVLLELQSTRPADLRMGDIALTARDRDQIFYANLGIAGCGARTWSLEGNLPDFLEFDDEVGAVRQKQGVEPRVFTSGPLGVVLRVGDYQLSSNPFKVLATAT